jgi:small subunit ribosomal protein S17
MAEKKPKKTDETVEDTTGEETQAEDAPVAEEKPKRSRAKADAVAEEAAVIEEAPEPVAEEALAEPEAEEAAVAEEPVADAEPVAEEAPVEEPEPVAEGEPEPIAEGAPVVETQVDTTESVRADAATTEEPVAEEAPEPDETGGEAEVSAGEPQSGPKPKRKRLPRALRPQKTRPTRERATTRKPIVRLEKPEHERGRRQERRGIVVSDAMDKTIVVKVDTIKAHPKYKKVVRRSIKFHAHDEENAAKVGDVVRIVETRPLSKTKRWRLAEVVEVAK